MRHHYRHRPRLLRHQNSPLLVSRRADKLRRTRTLHPPRTLRVWRVLFVCGSGRQPIQRDKTANDNYYLLTLAAIAKEIQQRGLPPECSVRIAAGLPLTSFGRDKPKFREYLLRSNQPVNFKFEGVEYNITIEEVAVFPQGYAALMTETGLLQDEPSMLLMDLGGWTVDLMRIDNAIPAADTAHSLELGMIRCVDDIREQVRRETGLSLTDAPNRKYAGRSALHGQRYGARHCEPAGAQSTPNICCLPLWKLALTCTLSPPCCWAAAHRW